MISETKLERMLQQAVMDSVVECPYCGAGMEPDAHTCYECGKPNPLIEGGYI